jgi:hypothetical protein
MAEPTDLAEGAPGCGVFIHYFFASIQFLLVITCNRGIAIFGESCHDIMKNRDIFTDWLVLTFIGSTPSPKSNLEATELI